METSMKAIITAGGRGTRLRPITWTLNKHLIPLANEPMLFHAIKMVAAVGIKEIGINVNPGDTEIRQACGDGSQFGVSFVFLEQKGGAVGVGHIVPNAKSFVQDDDVLLYFGDNILLGSLQKIVDRFSRDQLDCCLILSKVPDPQRFGVPSFDVSGRITRIIEKPEVPPSDFAVTGIYLYRAPLHYQAFQEIQPSARGEFEISDINDWFVQHGCRVGHEEVTGWWKDTGKPEDLLEGNQLLLNEMKQEEATRETCLCLEGHVQIQGHVKIGKGVKLGPRVLIRGPVVIGDRVRISDSYIGPHTSIGSDVTIAHTEIEHAIVMDRADICAYSRIVDSIIGFSVTVKSDKETLPNGHRLVIGENGYVEI
jgi:glucose-1-phosphate thymidylyltransferase